MMEFKSEGVEFEDDRNNLKGKVNLAWTVDFECRSWGIKSIEVSVPIQKIEFDGTREEKEEDVPFSGTFTLEDHQVDFPDDGGSIFPLKVFWDDHRRRHGKIDPGWVIEFN